MKKKEYKKLKNGVEWSMIIRTQVLYFWWQLISFLLLCHNRSHHRKYFRHRCQFQHLFLLKKWSLTLLFRYRWFLNWFLLLQFLMHVRISLPRILHNHAFSCLTSCLSCWYFGGGIYKRKLKVFNFAKRLIPGGTFCFSCQSLLLRDR